MVRLVPVDAASSWCRRLVAGALGVTALVAPAAAQTAQPVETGPDPVVILGAALVGGFVGALAANGLWNLAAGDSDGGQQEMAGGKRPMAGGPAPGGQTHAGQTHAGQTHADGQARPQGRGPAGGGQQAPGGGQQPAQGDGRPPAGQGGEGSGHQSSDRRT